MWNITIRAEYPLIYGPRKVIGTGKTLEDAIKEAEDWLKRELSTSDDPHAILTDENQIPHILDYDDIIEAIQNAAYNEEIFDRSDMLWPDDSLIKDINKEIASWTGAYPIIKEISGEPFWDRYWKSKPNEQ